MASAGHIFLAKYHLQTTTKQENINITLLPRAVSFTNEIQEISNKDPVDHQKEIL